MIVNMLNDPKALRSIVDNPTDLGGKKDAGSAED
jgi:hypothetical protein